MFYQLFNVTITRLGRYPRKRGLGLPFKDVITKAVLSPQLFKDHECWSVRSQTPELPHGSPVFNQLSDLINGTVTLNPVITRSP